MANILEGAAFFAAGVVLCLLFWWWKERSLKQARSLETQVILDKAQAEADRITSDARAAADEESIRLRRELERSLASRKEEQERQEARLGEREALINSQLSRLVETEAGLNEQKQALESRAGQLERCEREAADLMKRRREQLEKLAALSQADARAQLLKDVERTAIQEAEKLTRRILDEAKVRAEEKARHIISVAIQRYAGEHTFEYTTATVALPSDEIKGRIIGREGRNIRAFEAAAGVTILVDDIPGAVVISGFDPVRRQIGREAMERLIQDGRIHPTRIEEVIAQVTQEMEESILRLGEEAVRKAGLPPLHLEIVKLLGRLHFRHSYAQNILDHSVEVAHLMGLMAAELGLDVPTAKRAGLLHDIGKAVNHEIEGPHAVVGADLIKRHGELEPVVNAVASHHNDVPPAGPLGILVSAADAISASRPGARSESMTTYLKRIESLERIATSIPGVDKCFAAQAGREIRVFVQPDEVSEEDATALARKLAGRIENELQYPGQIRITVIRETRCVVLAT